MVSAPITEESVPTTTVLHGKLGINTQNPMEALTVVGNVLVLGGDIYRPSDERIKTNFRRVDNQVCSVTAVLRICFCIDDSTCVELFYICLSNIVGTCR